MPDERMLKAMELAAEDGGIAMVHAENGYCIDYLVDSARRRRQYRQGALRAIAAAHP